MQDQLKRRAEEVFCSALELESAEQRKIYLDHVCRRDSKLRAHVDRISAMQPAEDEVFRQFDLSQLLAEVSVQRGNRSAERLVRCIKLMTLQQPWQHLPLSDAAIICKPMEHELSKLGN